MRTASKAAALRIALAASALALAGCVSVSNSDGITPPAALCSHVRGTVGAPRGPIDMKALRSGDTGSSVHVKEWVFTGISADATDMMIRRAAENGGLRRIRYADYEQTSYLGFVTLFKLTAYGE